MNLYRVSLKVVLTEDHPMFWTAEFGVLHLWIYAEDEAPAAVRAGNIATQLPYGPFDGEWRAGVRSAGRTDDPPEFLPHENFAREVGFAMCVDYCQAGTDKADFATMALR
jgi:hypothetical protein